MAKYIIEIDENGNMPDAGFDSGLGKEMARTIGIQLAKKLKPYEEPEQGKPKRWRAERLEGYWRISDVGGIVHDVDHGTDVDNCSYNIGNYFRTRKEAEEYKESLIVYNELKAYAEPDDAEWGGDTAHWEIGYDHEDEGITVIELYWRHHPGLHFSSKESALSAIEAVGAEKIKRYYLRIKGE